MPTWWRMALWRWIKSEVSPRLRTSYLLSCCGLGAWPGQQLLRLRANPARPAVVPGLCPSAPECASPMRLSFALLVVMLRIGRAAGSLSLRLRTQTVGLCPPWFASVAPFQAPLHAYPSHFLLSCYCGYATRGYPYPFCPFGTFPPDRGNRPSDSGYTQSRLRGFVLALASVHPRCSARLRTS